VRDQISLGEEEAFTRLAFAIEVAEEAGAGPILHELELVLEAAVMARPGVALEIGGYGSVVIQRRPYAPRSSLLTTTSPESSTSTDHLILGS
jgi:hypothetical protein